MRRFLLHIVITLLAVASLYSQPIIVWSKVDTMPFSRPRIDYGYYVIDSNLYLFGGGDSLYNFYNQVWSYNLNSNYWIRKADLPAPARCPNIVANFTINSEGYFCTGLQNYDSCSKQFWKYSPSTDTWTQKSNFPGVKREAASAFTFGGKGYVGLGFACGAELNDLWEYDPLNDFWRQLDSLPSNGRDGSNIVVVDSFAVAIGGIDIGISIGCCSSETWLYNLINHSWHKGSDLPSQGRTGAICIPLNHKILYGCGLTSSLSSKGDFYLYNTITDHWQPVTSVGFLDSVGDGISFMYGNYGYFLGGTTSSLNYQKTLWRFDATDIYNYTNIAEQMTENGFSIYPTALYQGAGLHLQADMPGELDLYNTLGQSLYRSRFGEGNTNIQAAELPPGDQLLIYKATLADGSTRSGKLLRVK